MNLDELSKPLNINDIDFRVMRINKAGYATILAYKNARVDMQRLDEVCGPLNWKREHSRDNHNCIVSIWDDIKKQWVSKEDVGVESYAEKEKGLASDSFKRACFNWGIGRELYDFPIINIKLIKNEKFDSYGEWYIDKDKPKQGYGLILNNWKWGAKYDDCKLIHLAAKDDKGVLRYNWKYNG